MFKATIEGTNGETLHIMQGQRETLEDVYRWASFQGEVGYMLGSIVSRVKVPLTNEKTGESAFLIVKPV